MIDNFAVLVVHVALAILLVRAVRTVEPGDAARPPARPRVPRRR